MKTGAEIVTELKENSNKSQMLFNSYKQYSAIIHAALLAYDPPSPLRTILDRAEQAIREDHIYFSLDEITAARAELDALEGKL